MIANALTKSVSMGRDGMRISVGASVRRNSARVERSSTLSLVTVRACAHMPKPNAPKATLLTTKTVSANAAAPARAMISSMQTVFARGTAATCVAVCAGKPCAICQNTSTEYPAGTLGIIIYIIQHVEHAYEQFYQSPLHLYRSCLHRSLQPL